MRHQGLARIRHKTGVERAASVPLQGRHALDERDILGRRYDDVLDRGYELESVNEAILILAKLSDSVIAVRSAQDDYHAARSPAPSLRHHRKFGERPAHLCSMIGAF
jgi:hypothetical protein